MSNGIYEMRWNRSHCCKCVKPSLYPSRSKIVLLIRESRNSSCRSKILDLPTRALSEVTPEARTHVVSGRTNATVRTSQGVNFGKAQLVELHCLVWDPQNLTSSHAGNPSWLPSESELNKSMAWVNPDSSKELLDPRWDKSTAATKQIR